MVAPALTWPKTAIARTLPFIAGVAFVATVVTGDWSAAPSVTRDEPVRMLIGAPATIDPAVAGDAGSAAIIAQLFEGLVTFDADLQVRPALARSWAVKDGGRRIVFQLRDGLAFSDGTPLTGADVVRSWLRLIAPGAPSPLVSLMFDVQGALAFARGEVRDPARVGLRAEGLVVTIDLVRPAADFVNVVAGPTFAVVPPAIDSDPGVLRAGTQIGSGGYTLAAAMAGSSTLAANPHYWAGPPAISTIELIHDLGGRATVAAYEAGDLDYAPIGDFDASWIAYDEALGPDLRTVSSLSVQYYGFDTSRPPFDDARVRRAVGLAVDWRRIVELGAQASETLANSMVPIGIPGRSERDFLPQHDPVEARRLLAEAGYPGGAGFPLVTFMTFGGGHDAAILLEIRRELRIPVAYETMSDGYFDRLASEPPHIWSLGWVADYPGPNDFLGVLLGSDSSNNYGHWLSGDFDTAIAEALAAVDPSVARAAYDRAESIIQRDVPLVPLSYGTGWALSTDGLLGAGQNGLGFIRMAGLAWAD